jgi:hypothetical protein
MSTDEGRHTFTATATVVPSTGTRHAAAPVVPLRPPLDADDAVLSPAGIEAFFAQEAIY